MMSDSVCEGVRDSDSVIPSSVITAYRLAHYSFHIDSQSIDFAIDQFCPRIAELFKKLPRPTALCITAWNPLGQELTQVENEAASEELRSLFVERGLPFFSALGRASDGSWGPEPGYMIFGVTCVEAKRLGNRFRQNAVVWVAANAIPKLVLLR